jgi:hypothetical protein
MAFHLHVDELSIVKTIIPTETKGNRVREKKI